MASRTKRALFAIAALAGVGVLVHTMRAPSPSPPLTSVVAPHEGAQDGAQEASREAPRLRAWFASDEPPKPPALPPPRSAPSLAQQIDKLIGSGKPEDAFAAYRLVRDCIYFQRWKVLPFIGSPGPIRDMTAEEKSAEATLCAGLTERMKMDRVDHVLLAAKAGVMGADTAFMEAGPFGDPSALASRPGDPLVVAWKEQAIGYLTARAHDADVGSLTTLLNAYRTDNDVVAKEPLLALTYTVALHNIFQQLDLPAGAMPYDDIELRWMQQGLSAQQIAAATAAGAQIAEVFRARRAARR